MPSYKIRPGVLLTQICGENLLVAAKSARKFCPYYSFLNESAAFVWKMLEKRSDLEELEAAVAEEFEIEDAAETRGLILSLLENLEKNHYLLPVEQGGNHEE